MVKDYVSRNEFGLVKEVIGALKDDFTLSSNPNSRKGGLVGLAATAIALGRVSDLGGGAVHDNSLSYIPTLVLAMHRNEPTRAGTASVGMLCRSRPQSALLCLRVSVQHLQGGKGCGPHLLQLHV